MSGTVQVMKMETDIDDWQVGFSVVCYGTARPVYW